MNAEAPIRGPRATSGERHTDVTNGSGVRELIDRLELLPRLAALLDEITLLGGDIDVAHTLAAGVFDDLVALYADEGRAKEEAA